MSRYYVSLSCMKFDAMLIEAENKGSAMQMALDDAIAKDPDGEWDIEFVEEFTREAKE